MQIHGQRGQPRRCNGTRLTLGGINYGLEHQRDERYEKEVIDDELGRAPERCTGILGNGSGAGIFCGGSRVVGRDGGGSKTSVKSVERVKPPEPCEERSHFMAVAWRRRERGDGRWKMKGRSVYSARADCLRGPRQSPISARRLSRSSGLLSPQGILPMNWFFS